MDNYKKIIPVIPLFIILLAFFLEMSLLAEVQQKFPTIFGQKPVCGVDAQSFIERATGLLSGALPGNNTYHFLPGYPLYLAILYRFLGDWLLLPVFIQALLQLLGIAALYRIGCLIFSPLSGILAALGLATYKYYLFYLPCHDQSLITTPALILAVFLLLRFYTHQQSKYLLGAATALGVATLSRPTILTILPVIFLWLFWACYRVSFWQFGKNFMALLLPLLVIIGPFTWHNYQVSGRLVAISDNFGLNIFNSYSPYANGLDVLAHDRSQPAGVHFSEVLSQVEKGETTFVAEALRYMGEQPVHALTLTVKKTWLWFGEEEEKLIEPFFPWRINQVRTLAPLPLTWQGMAVLALLGTFLVSRKKHPYSKIGILWLVYGFYSLMTIIFFVQLRLRLPFVPYVTLWAAALLGTASTWSCQRPKLFWGVLALLLILSPLIPGIALLALIFAGLGLMPHLTRHAQTGYRWAAGGILLYLLLIGIWTQANALASTASQPIDTYLGPPVAGLNILGQTVRMDCNGFNQVDMTLGTFNDRHNQPVTFYLATDTSAQEILYTESFNSSSVSDYQKRRFSFPPITDSAGQTYFFFISSPTSTPDNAITGRGYTDTPLGRGYDKGIDQYPGGNAFAGPLSNLQPIRADIAFKARCNLTLWQKVQGVFTHFWPGLI